MKSQATRLADLPRREALDALDGLIAQQEQRRLERAYATLLGAAAVLVLAAAAAALLYV